MSTPIITRKGDNTFVASITGDGWECSAEFGSYIAASDFLNDMGFGYGIVEQTPARNSKPVSSEFARMMRENRAAGI